MKRPPGMRPAHKPRPANKDDALRYDVAHMIADDLDVMPHLVDDLAKGIIVIVRERVLQEIGTYARENVR